DGESGGGWGGVRVVESDQGRPQWLPRFGATDPEAVARRAVALGARVLRAAREEPAVLRDPWGAEFGITAVPAAG
uniref:VOC family protein n=1 Tax=Streptomyces sp. NRRL WC-3742 TaxID=1463934 RepID=UPI002D2199B1